LKLGDAVIVISNPEGLEATITNGLISAIRELRGASLFQISAPISAGSSGGPVFNDQGEVIAVVRSTLESGQNLNFAIPANEVARLLARPATPLRLAGLPRPKSDAQASRIAGSWNATFADSIASGQLVFHLAQAGDNVRGTYTSSAGGGGTVEGSIAGGSFNFQLTQSNEDCPGSYVGSVALGDEPLMGSYTGHDCLGAHKNGTFTMSTGTAPLVQQTVSPAAPEPMVEYGTEAELLGVRTVFVFCEDTHKHRERTSQVLTHSRGGTKRESRCRARIRRPDVLNRYILPRVDGCVG
jgi:hypothetical protein